MAKLLKSYNLSCILDYYDMIIESVINGQHKQAKEQFLCMPKSNRKDFILNHNLTESQKSAFIMYL